MKIFEERILPQCLQHRILLFFLGSIYLGIFYFCDVQIHS